MYCPHCGKVISKDSKFCKECGKAVSKGNSSDKKLSESMKKSSSDFKIKLIRCQACDSNLEVDPEKEILCCPYCGSNQIIIEDDSVRIEKIKAQKEENIARIKADQKTQKDKHTRKVMIIFAIAYVLLAIVIAVPLSLSAISEGRSFNNGDRIVASYSSSDYKGEDAQKAKASLEEMGFTNVRLVGKKRGVFSKGKEGEIIKVSIDDESFSRGDKLKKDGLIEITYYTDKLFE